MMISPADPSIRMGKAFGESVRPLSLASLLGRPATAAEIGSLVLTIDEAVGVGNMAFDAYIRFDLNWRTAMSGGKVEYDESTDNLIRDGLRTWALDAARLVSVVDSLAGFEVATVPLETLRGRIVEVRDMLTPDDQFFEGEALDRLAGEALAADERGETVPFEVMGE
jgi:hypothetical protein